MSNISCVEEWDDYEKNFRFLIIVWTGMNVDEWIDGAIH